MYCKVRDFMTIYCTDAGAADSGPDARSAVRCGAGAGRRRRAHVTVLTGVREHCPHRLVVRGGRLRVRRSARSRRTVCCDH